MFDPLGITTVSHDLDGIGVMSGGSHIDMTPQDFARFGLLYLRGGEWDGSQIVPEAWVDYARLPYPDAPNYGAHWWVAGTEDGFHGTFQANGFGGQTITIVPELDLVVVVLANVQDAAQTTPRRRSSTRSPTSRDREHDFRSATDLGTRPRSAS